MPLYSYRALNAKGKTIKGAIDAESPQKARQRLRSDGLHPMEIKETSKIQGRSRQTDEPSKKFRLRKHRRGLLAITTRQMSTLLAAGLPLVTVLSAILEQVEDQEFNQHMALIREDVTSGDSLAAALGRHPEIFPREYVHLVRAGEMAGALDPVLERLADNLEKSQIRRTKVITALAYPAFMALVGSGVLFFLFSFVVPTLTNLFENLEAALPWPTRLLLAFSGFLQNYWWIVILGLIGSILLFRRYLKKDKNYRRFETMAFKAPLFGRLFKQLRLAQVIRGLAVMTGGGVPLTTALSVTGQGLGRSIFAEAMASTADLVGQGRSLADALDATHLFPPLVRRMVAVGETSGTLNEMLVRVAQTYEDETDQVLAALTSLVEPIIILVIGLIAGFVVLAVLLPIFDLSGLVG